MRCDARLRANRRAFLALESLENRSLLAANGLTPVPTSVPAALCGDANLDGVFNSADLVQVFQGGKYETSQAADWSAGDWNFDGLFDSQDLIRAFQQGTPLLAEAKEGVPMKGSLQAVESFDVQFPTLIVNGSGSGNATHLGHFTVIYESEVYIPTLAGSGSAHFIAANGDRLFVDVTGQAHPTENPDVLSIVETYTIVSGTGRFDGASGVFTVERLLNSVTGDTSGSFDGNIII